MSAPMHNRAMQFPAVFWGKTRATFVPLGSPLPENGDLKASLVFACRSGGLILTEIIGRGWCIPGGHIEEGESAEVCVRREAWEEAGLTLGKLELIGHTLLYPPDEMTPVIVANFVGEVERFDPLPENSESTGIRFTSYDELPAVYYQWDPLLEAIFDFVRVATKT